MPVVTNPIIACDTITEVKEVPDIVTVDTIEFDIITIKDEPVTENVINVKYEDDENSTTETIVNTANLKNEIVRKRISLRLIS